MRLAVLTALEELLLCGAGQSVETLVGWRLKNNVPDFTKQQQEFADQLTKRKAALKAKVEKTAP